MKENDIDYFPIRIIEYKSNSFRCPLYSVWFTDIDENETDRVLTSTPSQIIWFKEIDVEKVSQYLEWIKFPLCITDDTVVYDVNSIRNSVEKGTLSDGVFEDLVNLINLFGDFAYQDKANFHLKRYIKDEYINSVWQYYYEYIFFPKFYNKEIDKPFFNIDYKQLLISFNCLCGTFESCFDVV